MATLSNFVDALLRRSLTAERSGGRPASELEVQAVLEVAVATLSLSPRAPLYLLYLAANRLLDNARVLSKDFAALRELVQDTANRTYAVKDTGQLKEAKGILQQMQTSGGVTTGRAFDRFSQSIDTFLAKQLKKNVRKKGSVTIARSGEEARQGLSEALATVIAAHAAVVTAARYLSEGAQAFLDAAPWRKVALLELSRATEELDELNSIVAGGGAGRSTELALRLFAVRAVVQTIVGPTTLNTTVLDSLAKTPPGYNVQGVTPNMKAVAQAAISGDVVLPANAEVSISVASSVLASKIPQSDLDLNNRACIVGDEVTFPTSSAAVVFLGARLVTGGSPPDSSWVLDSAARYVKVFRVEVPSGSSLIQAAQSITDNAPGMGAREFIGAGKSNRLLVYVSPSHYDRLRVEAVYVEPEPASTTGDLRIFTLSSPGVLGFSLGQSGLAGATPVKRVIEAMNGLFGTLVEVTSEKEILVVRSVADDPGTQMTITCPSVLGVSGTFTAEETLVSLQGTLFEVQESPVSPVGVVSQADFLEHPNGEAEVLNVSAQGLLLATAVPTFSGPIVVHSRLVRVWTAITAAIAAFLAKSPNTALDGLEQLLSRVLSSGGRIERAKTDVLLAAAQAQIDTLVAALSTEQTTLPSGAAEQERAIVRDLLAMLTERRLTRVKDLLMSGRLVEGLACTWETASYGAALLSATAILAKTDILFPNLAQGERNPIIGPSGD